MKKKGGKVPEAKLGRCIRSKEKELLDKCDGLATAAGNETRPKYYYAQHCIRDTSMEQKKVMYGEYFFVHFLYGLILSVAGRLATEKDFHHKIVFFFLKTHERQ